jgi:hypothetical protein
VVEESRRRLVAPLLQSFSQSWNQGVAQGLAQGRSQSSSRICCQVHSVVIGRTVSHKLSDWGSQYLIVCYLRGCLQSCPDGTFQLATLVRETVSQVWDVTGVRCHRESKDTMGPRIGKSHENQLPNQLLGFHPSQVCTGTWVIFLMLVAMFVIINLKATSEWLNLPHTLPSSLEDSLRPGGFDI